MSSTTTVGRITVAIGTGIAAVAIALTAPDIASARPPLCQDDIDCRLRGPTITPGPTTTTPLPTPTFWTPLPTGDDLYAAPAPADHRAAAAASSSDHRAAAAGGPRLGADADVPQVREGLRAAVKVDLPFVTAHLLDRLASDIHQIRAEQRAAAAVISSRTTALFVTTDSSGRSSRRASRA